VILLRRQRAKRHETANEQESENNAAVDHRFFLSASALLGAEIQRRLP
jgi:hypothetical protein